MFFLFKILSYGAIDFHYHGASTSTRNPRGNRKSKHRLYELFEFFWALFHFLWLLEGSFWGICPYFLATHTREPLPLFQKMVNFLSKPRTKDSCFLYAESWHMGPSLFTTMEHQLLLGILEELENRAIGYVFFLGFFRRFAHILGVFLVEIGVYLSL